MRIHTGNNQVSPTLDSAVVTADRRLL